MGALNEVPAGQFVVDEQRSVIDDWAAHPTDRH
jgi:hypothetical protein